MSVLESLRTWLCGYNPAMEALTLEQLGADPEALGLFRTPEAQITPFVDGSRDVTAFYDFFLRFPSQTDDLRADCMEQVEALERWVLQHNMSRDLPQTGSGKECYDVFVSGGGSLIEQTDAESVYHITICIRYFEEATR